MRVIGNLLESVIIGIAIGGGLLAVVYLFAVAANKFGPMIGMN